MSAALLIDAENIPAKYADNIMKFVNQHTYIKYKRLYGDFSSNCLNAWKNASITYKLEPIQIFHLIKGKNTADIALCIDAIEIAIQDDSVDTFIIVTSDSDMTVIINKLSKYQKKVILLGQDNTHELLIKTCDNFINLTTLEEKQQENKEQIKTIELGKNTQITDTKTATSKTEDKTIAKKSTTTLPSKTQLKIFITKYIKSSPKQQVFSSVLQKELLNKYTNYSHKNYGYAKFSAFIQSLGYNFDGYSFSLKK